MASIRKTVPIEHVVIIIKENHCFDNYFGTFPGANGAKLERAPNPPPHDPNHRHDAWLTRTTTAVRQQFVEQDIPAYFAYARQFTLCDNYFTDVAGPSTPNHLMLITADSPPPCQPAAVPAAGGRPVIWQTPTKWKLAMPPTVTRASTASVRSPLRMASDR